MSINTLIFLNLTVIVFVLLLVIYFIFKLKKIEEKTLDISARDIVAFVEQMREMVIESEKAAETMDSSIKQREAVLEDLSSLVESRIAQFNAITDPESILEREKILNEQINEQNIINQRLLEDKNRLEQQLEKIQSERDFLLKEKTINLNNDSYQIPKQLENIKSLQEIPPINYTNILPANFEKEVSHISSPNNSEIELSNIIMEAKKDLIDEDMLAEIYKLLLNGYSEEQIAEILNLNIEEVEKHTSLNK